jgi:NTP pyrophosphatase (non-canonical NTP hydrolase)
MTVAELTAQMHDFVRTKGWYDPSSPHPQTPRNLAISLNLEAAEVLELFQWTEACEREDLAGELADVMLYLLQLADVSGIDLAAAVVDKLAENQGRSWPPGEVSDAS